MTTTDETYNRYQSLSLSDSLEFSVYLYLSSNTSKLKEAIGNPDALHHLLELSGFNHYPIAQTQLQNLLTLKENIKVKGNIAREHAPYDLTIDNIDEHWMSLNMEEEMVEVILAYEAYTNILHRTLTGELHFNGTTINPVKKMFLNLLCEISDLLCSFYVNDDFTSGPPDFWFQTCKKAFNALINHLVEFRVYNILTFIHNILTSLDIFAIFMTDTYDWYRVLGDIKSLIAPKHAGKIQIIIQNTLSGFETPNTIFANVLRMGEMLVDHLEHNAYKCNQRHIILPQN